ncbi:hypothetical protein GCM10022217_31320 [Chryseobacterium ginsenosidimutans]|uniref:hypothetical protein n=1 Tax=Chryseobacterium ginsenosidimutans TaxID=687846 RepID=UPI0031D52060
MIEILENIYYFLAKILPYSFGTMFIGFLIAFVANSIKKSKVQNIGIALLVQGFVLAFIMIVLQTVILKKIKDEVLEILSDLKTQLIVSRNDFEILPHDLKKELLKIQDIPTNHSHPEDEKTIEVISPKGIFKITIARDSNNKNQFWIFTDKYEFSKKSEIGKVNSNLIK